ncbi:MAG: glycosyltransferase family 4 protein [Thermodesulfobacteriota bacterium]
MKILLISAFFPPEVGSAAHLYYELGQALRSRGHEVTVLTGLPRYHVAEPGGAYRRRPLIYETYHGLRVVRTFNLKIPWDIPVLRGADQFVFAFFAAGTGMLLPPFDVALVYSPPLPLALAAWGLCRLRRRPLVVNVQDLFPQSAIDLGLLHNPYLIRFFRGLETFLYQRADLVMVHSEGNRRLILASGGAPERVMTVSNWVDTAEVRPGRRDNWVRTTLGLNQRFLVSFAGIMGYSQDLETVLQSADLLRDEPEIAFVLVGDGVEKPKLVEMVRRRNLTNVFFLPMQPKERYPDVLAASDLCLATLRPEVKTPVVPSKILSIMAAGRPVLAGLPLEGDAPALISEAGCGLAVPPGRPDSMAQAIRQLYRHPEERLGMGANGRQYAVEYLSLAKWAERLEKNFAEICARG